MDIAGYSAAIFIGISLGLVGGGGSVLTVPVLVYLFHLDAILSTTYSLFIVGITSLAGSATYLKKGLVDTRIAFLFGIPSVIAVLLTRTYLVPAIPAEIFRIGEFSLTKNTLLLVLFALLMVLASYSMIRKGAPLAAIHRPEADKGYPRLVIQGIFIGAITGLIGAGGGFLIIPALVNLLKMPMKTAIGTSLLIIAINSLSGFLFSLHHSSIHWSFLLSIAAIAVLGILIGSAASARIDGKKLKPAFGWFVLVTGIYILTKELILK